MLDNKEIKANRVHVFRDAHAKLDMWSNKKG